MYVFFVLEEGADRTNALVQAAELRRAGVSADLDYAGRSVKGQMTQAGRLRARVLVRVGPDNAVVRTEGVDAPPIAVTEIAASVLGHPGPPPAADANE